MKFGNSKKGDLVWDILVGPGVIIYIDEKRVNVQIENELYRYDLNGYDFDNDKCKIRLFKYEEKEAIYKRPIFKIKHKKRFILIFYKNGTVKSKEIGIDDKINLDDYYVDWNKEDLCAYDNTFNKKVIDENVIKVIDQLIEYEEEK